MRPFFAALLVLVLVLSAGVLRSQDTASAAGTAEVGFDHDGAPLDINDGPALAAPGGDLTISLLTVLPPDGLGAWELEIYYDPSVFAIGSGDCTAFGGSGSAVCNEAFAPNVIKLAGASTAGNFGTFNLADLTFHAVGSAGECSDVHVGAGPGLIFTDPSIPPIDLTVELSNGRICIDGTNGAVGIDHDLSPPDINAGPVNLTSGDIVKLGLVTATPSPNLGAWEIDIHYDPAVLQPVSCDPYPAGGVLSVCNELFGVMEVRSVGAAAGGITGVVNLANFEFRAIGPVGSCSLLEVEIEQFTDNATPTPREYNPALSTGEVCVDMGSADVNGDGVINGRDLRMIARAAIFGPFNPAFDLNGDQKINFADFTLAIIQLVESRFP